MTNQSQVFSGTDRGASRMPAIALCGFALIVAAFFFAMNPTFVAMHAKEQARLAEEVARENTAFCEKRGLTAGSRQHADCVADLNEIRAKQEDRAVARAAGML